MTELLPIDNGRQQSSFRKITITIPSGGSYKFDNPFNYFRCYDATFDFQLSWSTNSDRTDFGAGFGVRFDVVLPYVLLFNPGVTPLTVSIGVGIGYFDDSRLTVSSVVKTNPAPYTFFNVTQTTVTNGRVTIPAASKTIIQNTSENVMYIGGTGTDGLQLQPQGSFEFALNDNITVFGIDGDTLTIGSFN